MFTAEEALFFPVGLGASASLERQAPGQCFDPFLVRSLRVTFCLKRLALVSIK